MRIIITYTSADNTNMNAMKTAIGAANAANMTPNTVNANSIASPPFAHEKSTRVGVLF